ncbi:MAG: glutathione peroxidase, partial [Dermatophilaceae bacterium]
MTALSDFSATTLTGQERALSEYDGKVVLVVNTASKCGFTPQLEGLEKLYEELQDDGLVVLGFPCNQFGHQEPGSAEEISDFCQLTY